LSSLASSTSGKFDGLASSTLAATCCIKSGAGPPPWHALVYQGAKGAAEFAADRQADYRGLTGRAFTVEAVTFSGRS
jgi:hypothetical protein